MTEDPSSVPRSLLPRYHAGYCTSLQDASRRRLCWARHVHHGLGTGEE